MSTRASRTLLAIYILLAVATIAYGLVTYAHLHRLYPGPQVNRPPEALSWYTAYGSYLKRSAVLLGVALGSLTGYLGMQSASRTRGAGSLLILWLLTSVSFGLLPDYYLPYCGGDEFSAWLMFMAGSLYPAIGGWLVVTLGVLVWHRAVGYLMLWT